MSIGAAERLQELLARAAPDTQRQRRGRGAHCGGGDPAADEQGALPQGLTGPAPAARYACARVGENPPFGFAGEEVQAAREDKMQGTVAGMAWLRLGEVAASPLAELGVSHEQGHERRADLGSGGDAEEFRRHVANIVAGALGWGNGAGAEELRGWKEGGIAREATKRELEQDFGLAGLTPLLDGKPLLKIAGRAHSVGAEPPGGPEIFRYEAEWIRIILVQFDANTPEKRGKLQDRFS